MRRVDLSFEDLRPVAADAHLGGGDARDPDLAQDLKSPAGKLLRLTPEGQLDATFEPAGDPAAGP